MEWTVHRGINLHARQTVQYIDEGLPFAFPKYFTQFESNFEYFLHFLLGIWYGHFQVTYDVTNLLDELQFGFHGSVTRCHYVAT